MFSRTTMNGSEEARTIRYPATANLMVDSADRNEAFYSSPWSFNISKDNSILNGFFNRIGTTEVILEWAQPNISPLITNNNIAFDLSGTGANTFSGVVTINVPTGFYNVAQALNSVCALLTDLSGTTGMAFGTATTTNFGVVIACVGGVFSVITSRLAIQLGINSGLGGSSILSVINPDLRPYRYIDFVSSQLTYNQDLKDSSTDVVARDVLCRWYFAFDNPVGVDSLGFPILMGYSPFYLRRIFNPPKQIRWDNIQPIGNLTFEVYGDDNQLVYFSNVYKSQWLMTLQVSEN